MVNQHHTTIETINNVGHWPALEAEARTTELLIDFLLAGIDEPE
jgi:pimeloyl-ACP methyl ester carboxylesterase